MSYINLSLNCIANTQTDTCTYTCTCMCMLQIVSPSCIAYLDNGVAFVGSYLGDSQLVKVNFNCNVLFLLDHEIKANHTVLIFLLTFLYSSNKHVLYIYIHYHIAGNVFDILNLLILRSRI